jgi:beta,beta-carotene 9',10'-dioxygenase
MAGFGQGFRTQSNELHVDDLPLQGAVPNWLSGSLVRVTPAQFEVGDSRYRHWFDGLSMLHGFTLNNGRVSYLNRYLQTPAYRENNEAGAIKYSEFATDPCRSLFSRLASFFTPPHMGANANVTATRLADEYIARTEVPMSVKFDPQTLETLGLYHHEGMDGQVTTAHPHHDFRRNMEYTYQLQFGRKNRYVLYGMPGGRNPRQIAELPIAKPAYMHSFGMSGQYLILTEFPLKLSSSLKFVLGNKPFIENYQWMPEEGTRITVFDKDTGRVVKQTTTEPFFAFHHVNAFERGDELVMDIAAYEDSSIIDQFYLDNLRADNPDFSAHGRLRRYRLPLAESARTPTYETISETGFDLPRYNYTHWAGKPYRFVFGVSTREGTRDFTNQIVKIDLERGATSVWFEKDMYPGEPVYVPAQHSSAEDDGAVLSVVLDGKRGISFLLLLDAKTFTEQARAEVPQHIPFGFHGEFFSSLH